MSIDYAVLKTLVDDYTGKDEYPMDEVAVLHVIVKMLYNTLGSENIDDLPLVIIDTQMEHTYRKSVKYIRSRGTMDDMRQRYYEYLEELKGLDDAGAHAISSLLTSQMVLSAIDELRAEGVKIYVTNYQNAELENLMFARIYRNQRK